MHNITLPNFLTILRLLLAFPILYLLNHGLFFEGTLLTLFAFFTDFLDGRLARYLNSATRLGSILDPVADKLIILFLLAFFAYADRISFAYFYFSSIRDVSQLMSIPVLMGWKKINFQVKPRHPAKIATALKFAILGILLLQSFSTFAFSLSSLLTPLILLSFVFEVYILLTYLHRFSQIYRGTHDTFN